MSSNASGSSTSHGSIEVYTSQTPCRTRSNVWEHYEPNLVDVDGDLKVVCKCRGLHLNSKSGTSSLRGHIANACPAIETPIKQRFQATMSKQPSAENFVFDPKVCREEMIKYIMHAEIPFLKFEDPYLKPWLKTLQPTFKVRGRRTIRSDCLKKYERMKKELQLELRNLDSRVCLTSYIWTSSQNLGYMAVTAHYIDAEFKIKKKIIWFKELEYHHSGYAIEEELLRCLADWDIREKIFTLTLDNASNNTAACELLVTDCKHELMFGGEHMHVRCCAHILNILVQDGMKIIHSSNKKIRELLRHIDSSVSRLQEFNSIAVGKSLPSKAGIYLDIPTRWNSTYKMLKEALKYKVVLNTYATKYCEVSPSEEEWAKAQAICVFLKGFEELTLLVSAHREPTSHKFLPLVLWIQHALKVDPAWQTSELLKELATSMCSKFEKYWDPNEDNLPNEGITRRRNKEIAFNLALVIATFLDPRRKVVYLKFFFKKVCRNVDQIAMRVNSALDWTRKYFTRYERQHPRMSRTYTMTHGSDVLIAGSPVLGKRQLEAEFAEYRTQVRVKQAPKSEIDVYLEEEMENDVEDFDVLAWWKSRAEKYPVLSKMARDFLAIPLSHPVRLDCFQRVNSVFLSSKTSASHQPPTSQQCFSLSKNQRQPTATSQTNMLSIVPSKSAFSTRGRILGDHRSSLSPQMVEALIFPRPTT